MIVLFALWLKKKNTPKNQSVTLKYKVIQFKDNYNDFALWHAVLYED